MIFNMSNLSTMLPAIQGSGYFLVFILMVIEGPIVTYVAAIASSFGFFDIWVIFFLSLFGNLLPDMLFYSIGRYSRGGRIERSLSNYFGLTNHRIKKIEENLKKHAGKTIFIVKITPILPIPGLILAGFAKISLRKFIVIDFLFNFVAAIIFVALGFYSGITVNNISKYLKIGEIIIPALIILVVAVYFLFKKVIRSISEKERI